MYQPITYTPGVETITLDPILDAPTAPHCAECGETLYGRKCVNVATCPASHEQASPKRLGKASASTNPRAWTLGGRVD